jgi:translation initiation factor 5
VHTSPPLLRPASGAQVLDEDILKDEQVKATAKLFARLQKLCTKPKSAQTVMLVCIERLCGERFEEQLLKKTPKVLEAFYDADLLEEEAILHWAGKKTKSGNREASKKVKKAAEPFITWLKEAEEDEEEDDDDDES